MVVTGPLAPMTWGTADEFGSANRSQLVALLRQRMATIRELTATVTVDQVKDCVTITVADHDRLRQAMREAEEIKGLLELSYRADEIRTRIVEPPEVEKPPPARISPEVWAQAERNRAEDEKRRVAERAEEARLERLRQVRKACETAADSFDQHAFRRRAPEVKRWHRWVFAAWVIAEREAAYAAGLDAEQERHVLAVELRDTAALPDDILEWLLGEGWTPPKPEVWVWLD